MASALILLAACNGGDVTSVDDRAVDATPASVLFDDAVVGSTITKPVRLAVALGDGTPARNVRVTWSASHNGKASLSEGHTDQLGIASVEWTLGTVAGSQKLTARVAGLDPVVFGVNAKADRAARINAPEEIQIALLGDTVALSPTVVDRFGNPVDAAPAYSIESSEGASQLLTDRAAIVALNRGTDVLRISADTVTRRVVVRVSPAAPRPLRVVGDSIRPGVPFAIDGESFATIPTLVDVSVSGVKAQVLSATRNRIEAMLPAGSVPCQATAQAQVKVSIGAATGELMVPLRIATRLQLQRGESASLLGAGEAACTELVSSTSGSSARFVVAVMNASQNPSAVSSFELRGNGAGGMAGLKATSLDVAAAHVSDKTGQLPPALSAQVKAQQGHAAFLDKQRDVARRAGSARSLWQARKMSNPAIAATEVAPTVGSVVTVKALYSSCYSGRDIQARVVYAGTRALVLEDVAAPRAGTMDADYRAIGEEFDAVQYRVLADNIGDPLAMNAAMQGDGRVTMLFTRYVNDSLPGIGGYVSACNFYPQSTFAGSNEDEVFYARVPSSSESPADWRRSMRSTVVHEAKHIASFAERLSRGNPFEESWLEEATARVAEELYSREFAGGGAWKGNAGYQTTVRCEIYQCDGRPLMMWKHFSTLHSFQQQVDQLSPIAPSSSGDFTHYASGWSLVRWAADHYAANESQWLKELVRGGAQTGIASLSQRTGRSVGKLLGDWALATAVDDLENFTPARTELTMPSWNTAAIMRGLSETYPGTFVAAPLKMRNYTFGQFVLPVAQLRAFSASYFSFSGSENGSQVIELRGQGDNAIRLAVVRVQ